MTTPLPLLVPSFVGGSPLYVSGEDAILVRVFNAAASVKVRLVGRFLPTSSGPDDCPVPQPFETDFTPATDRTVSTLVQGLGEGWLLEATLFASSGSPLIGQCFAQLALQRGLASSSRIMSHLAGGYITAQVAIAWPASPIVGPLDGGGALRSIAGTTPAVGAEISETVPTGARWELISFRAQLVTSGVASTRQPRLLFDDGAAEYFRSANTDGVAASTTDIFAWFQGASGGTTPDATVGDAPIPIGNRLGAGHRIRTISTPLLGGDQYSAVRYLVREWLEGA